MNLWRSLVYGAGLLILATAAVVAHAQIEPSAVIAIAPTSLELAPGQEGEVAIEARNVRDLSAIDDLKLTFDPTAVVVIDSDPARDGVQVEVGRFLAPDLVTVNWVDNRAGTIRLMVTQLSPSPPKSGAGVLAIVRVQAQAAGAISALTIERAVLARADGSQHPVTLVNGRVTVVEGANPPPTFTPQPTQAAEPLPPTATPTEEPAPTEAPVLPTAPTLTPPTPTATAASGEPEPTPQALSPESPTLTPAVPATVAIPTEVSAPTDAPISPTATTMLEAAPAPVTPTAVVVARADTAARPGAQPPSAVSTARPASPRARLLLVAGGGLVGLAAILGGLAIVVYLRSRR